MTESENNQDSEVEVEPVYDPEGYVQERRLKDIFDAKEKVRERRIKAKEYQFANEGDGKALNGVRMYRTAVENYLTELKSLFLEDMNGRGYWYNLDMGEIVIPPPENDKYVIEPEPEKIDLTGLQSIFDVPEPIVVEFDVIRRVGTNKVQETVKQRGNIPFSKLDVAVQSANQYLSDRGFELDPEDDTDPASI
jgi:hypothetical protein